VVID
jgi:chaperonin GroEL